MGALAGLLTKISWTDHIAKFDSSAGAADRVELYLRRLALWARQLEIVETARPSLGFVRQLQVESQFAATLAALALYKPAAGAIRAMVESAMYYTYFRTHLQELATLNRRPEFRMTRSKIMEYHELHTPRFAELRDAFGLKAAMETWYSDVSSIVHGSIPGTWLNHAKLDALKFDSTLLGTVVDKLELAERLVHHLFFCTVASELWHGFAIEVRRELKSGLSGKQKDVLALPMP